ncbi:glycosyltransferase family 2 protein [Geobacter luticola]|uniref:Glycosyltransferase family 2 protein n=2 Tax=Geomobilimonas luticola TaxID=1114878 RepID=A0ABS5SCQ1_9BACT|nr:glycosyltransferase family 2 protein [Geomobilimonas luticola]
MLPRVVIIILNWNGKDDTSECLESLNALTYSNYEIIVVDNGSTDGSQRYIKEKYPQVLLMETGQNLGFTGGNNRGITAALQKNADYVLLLNNDTVVDGQFLDELVFAGESRKDVGILNPKIYYYDEPRLLWYAGGNISLLQGLSRHFGFQEIDHGQYDTTREVNFITGCAFLIKREVIEKIGPLDDNFFCYSEDADWSLRAIKAGYKGLYVPSSRIWHKIGISANVKGTEFSMHMGTRNALYLEYKHASRMQFASFLLVFSVNWLLRNAVKSLLNHDYPAMRGMYTGVTAFWSMPNKQRYRVTRSEG